MRRVLLAGGLLTLAVLAASRQAPQKLVCDTLEAKRVIVKSSAADVVLDRDGLTCKSEVEGDKRTVALTTKAGLFIENSTKSSPGGRTIEPNVVRTLALNNGLVVVQGSAGRTSREVRIGQLGVQMKATQGFMQPEQLRLVLGESAVLSSNHIDERDLEKIEASALRLFGADGKESVRLPVK